MPAENAGTSKGMLWTGRIISGLIVALLLFAVGFGIFKPEMSRQGFTDMGYPASAATPVLIALITAIVLYAIPRTSALGAILITGYMGGAIATHVRLGQGMFVIPFFVAALAWLGIYLRENRLRAVLPHRR
ncbi:MAG: DoxX family protein [Candidatus Acidiferrales bacterium]